MTTLREEGYIKPIMKCSHCGHTGTDVHIYYEHIGGHSDLQPVAQCDDGGACWRRWDIAHGFITLPDLCKTLKR